MEEALLTEIVSLLRTIKTTLIVIEAIAGFAFGLLIVRIVTKK